MDIKPETCEYVDGPLKECSFLTKGLHVGAAYLFSSCRGLSALWDRGNSDVVFVANFQQSNSLNL